MWFFYNKKVPNFVTPMLLKSILVLKIRIDLFNGLNFTISDLNFDRLLKNDSIAIKMNHSISLSQSF
jgi:hypothetical protein